MLHNQEDIERLFQDSFKEFEVSPADSVKESIDKELFANNAVGKRFGFFWLGVILLITCSFTLIILNYGKKEVSRQNIIAKHHHKIDNTQIQSEKIEIKRIKKQLPNTSKVKHDKRSYKSDLSNLGQSNESYEIVRPSGSEELTKEGAQNNYIKKEKLEIVSTIYNETPNDMTESNLKRSTSQDINDAISGTEYLDSSQLSLNKTNPIDQTISLVDSAALIAINANQGIKKDSSITNQILSIDTPTNQSESSLWSIGVFIGMEEELPNLIDDSGIGTLQDATEYGAISSSIFDFRIGVNRQFTSNISIGSGIGFASNNVKQSGKVYTINYNYQGIDTVYVSDSAGSVIDTNFVDVYTQEQVVNSFSSNYLLTQINIPISISGFYRWNNFGLGMTAGFDFSFSNYTPQQTSVFLSNPSHQVFGVSTWLRPEISYRIKQYEIFGYGTMRTRLKEQLKWSFINDRRSSFGGGIALRYYLP